ncbi:TPA: AAA family ATPase [Pseudomonas aeruginosa]|uniref:McrB family protein n=1 Tax=Pseudomonas aeruginosa TaxID=287 RepID=UPI000E323106|nr:AAA family ATPase [Pseudomonas aeruginosa]NPX94447.1 AAA domain-containing protein [Pseudomonas aeruginosa]
MSLYNPHHNATPVFAAINQWKQDCLLDGQALFAVGPRWTSDLLGELQQRFVESPDESAAIFLEKLKGQLAAASPEAIQLMAEVLWVVMLFQSNVKPTKKRENIKQVWSWSGSDFPANHPLIADDVLEGLGSAGQGFNRYRAAELAWLIRMVEAFHQLPRAQQEKYLSEPWHCAEWLDAQPWGGGRQMRHVLLHLLFPETFERIASPNDKAAIISAFNNLTLPEAKAWPAIKLDRTLLDIRQSEEAAAGPAVDFYTSPWADRWRLAKPEAQQPPPSGKPLLVAEPRNLIFYGPPGTGKTHSLKKRLSKYQDSSSTLTETEWVVSNLVDVAWWQVVFMALYTLGGKATVNQLMGHRYFVAKAKSRSSNSNLRATCWEALQSHALLDSATVQRDADARRSPHVFDKDAEGKWFLAGDWEGSCAEWIERAELIKQGPKSTGEQLIKRYEFVTFHQSYSYEDFIEGIRPEPSADGQGVTYAVKPGVFKRLCERARLDPQHRYAIFIDEINRGNVARILGELITLIEIDKRAHYDADGQLLDGMELTLPYSGEHFGVPRNLDIYGSMNTADRSIALLDAALRRRFQFRELMPDSLVISGAQGDGYIPDSEGGVLNLRALLDTLNRRIAYLLHRDQTIGHAFLTRVSDMEGLRSVLCREIIPLLQEVFYNDWQRIRLIFGDVKAPLEMQIVREFSDSASDIFGELEDDLPESRRYEVCSPGEISPEAIRKIYEPLA